MTDIPEKSLISKLIATAWQELLDHPVTTFAAIIAILASVGTFTKKGRNLIKNAIQWACSKVNSTIPKETIRIIPNPHERWWHMGKSGNEPAMQVVTRLHVTNITDEPVTILSAKIKPTNISGHVFTRHPEKNVYGTFPILPRHTVPVSADFWIKPPVKKPGDNFKATVFLIDQYGNTHKTKITFISDIDRKKKEEPKIEEEKLSDIHDPLEKQVISILKDEANRYKICGRRTGGLGSVETNYQNRRISGVPSDGWKPDSSEQQMIVNDPSKVTIRSDNLEAFRKVLENISNNNDKDRIISFLSARISRDNEYSSIGYFFLLAFKELGRLPELLNLAKTKLQGDRKYGFSDLLRLLDALLKYKHDIFSEKELDEIENFLEDVKEHKFRIKERLAAIRTHRLSKIK